MIPLNESDFAIVSNNHLLENKHIDYFAFLLHRQFGYAYREAWYVQHPELIEKLDTNKLHIQILHSRDTDYAYNENEKYSTDHWVCSYYDTKKIYIFESANRKHLHKYHRIVLERLYPDF